MTREELKKDSLELVEELSALSMDSTSDYWSREYERYAGLIARQDAYIDELTDKLLKYEPQELSFECALLYRVATAVVYKQHQEEANKEYTELVNQLIEQGK